LSVANAQVIEGNTGSKSLNVFVAMSKRSALTVSVHYATANGLATAGSDYTAAAGDLTFTPGQNFKIVPVTIAGDTIYEANETFSLTLSLPSGATLLKAVGTETITNDDPTVPSVPRAVAAAPGNAQAIVSWTLPLQNGGTAITGYSVTPYVGAVAQNGLTKTFAASARSASIPGLTNGTVYTFRVAATNAIGKSLLGLSPAIRVGAPTAPRLPAASPSSAAAVVSWTAPAAANASALSGYRINAYAGATLTKSVTVGVVSQATVSGLTNATSYTFRVGALNSIGAGPLSAATVPIIAGTPSAPANVTSAPDLAAGAKASVHWTAPGSNGGSAITGYIVTPYINGVAKPVRRFNSTATTQTVKIDGLTPGAIFTFKVAAINARGTGKQSATSNTSKVK
jgi:titin